ncbi:hypothetical protein LDENG_00063320 [Lucifuga dentata]|nr:hypothetical protein LDENG_00063320 [Lucifuga dentata]
MKKCDSNTNPNPKSLFEDVMEIIKHISMLLSIGSGKPLVMKHPTGTIYQNSFAPADLNSVELGSEEDGMIKLPPYSAIASYVSNYQRVIAQIFMPRPNASSVMNSSIVLERNTKALTQFNISDPNATVIFSAKPNVNVSLVLFLSYGSPPNSTYYSNTTILSSSGNYRWILPSKMFQGTPGVWYINVGPFNSSWKPGLTLQIASFMTKCMYWDTKSEVWSTHGCRVGNKTTPDLTQCLCNHLTLFGSSFFVMPNYVDLSCTAELFATVTENFVVLALLCAFFGLYLIMLLGACYADRRASSKRKMTLLEDNHACAQYNYLISVQTGHRKNAGTSSNVTVRLIGTEGESETHTLTDPDKPVFERGSVDMFLLANPFPLGDLRNLRLQHDNCGGHPSWYINKVTIQDLQTRQVWHFLCDCWLSTDHGDGMTKRTFSAARSNEIASFRNIFQTRTSTGFRDEHIWVSIVDPPSRSPFTRAQRVSCCMSLLLCTMAINIAFWNIPEDQASPVLFSMGSMEITWQEIMVGIECGLLMFPINILIITIFRSIKPRVPSKTKKRSDEESFKVQAVTIPSILKETEEMLFLVSKSQRNKISELHRLESSSDLFPALDRVHDLIQLMQGECESDHHWVYCSKFILCCLSHLLLCLDKLNKSFASPDEYQQALNTTNVLVRKAEMVYTSHMTYCPPPVRRKKTSAGCWLPWWCVFVGWFLLLSISGVSTFFTLLYGFQYGKQKSIKWVISLGLSLFQSIFILQPLKVIGVAVVFALLLKPVAVEETEEIDQVLSGKKMIRKVRAQRHITV